MSYRANGEKNSDVNNTVRRYRLGSRLKVDGYAVCWFLADRTG